MANEMERRMGVEDRGPVEAMCDGAMQWVVCCARCNHVAHIVISREGIRHYACPRCLVLLDGSHNGPPRNFRDKRGRPHNRIRGYLDEERERYPEP